jgi:hypothetical protein
METKKNQSLSKIQGIAPLAYATMVAIGMLFEYHRYKVFGINIFQYADIFDFLIAPFKDFNIIGALLLIAFSLSLGHMLDRLMKRWPKFYYIANFGLTKKSWYNNYLRASFTLIFISLLFFASDRLAESNYKQVVSNKNEVEIMYADNEIINGNLIGKTKEVVFLFKNESVTVIPSTSFIKKIEFKKIKKIDEELIQKTKVLSIK